MSMQPHYLPACQSTTLPPSPPLPEGVTTSAPVKSRTWTVSVVLTTDCYGLNGCLVNHDEPLVIFECGGLSGTYRASTLLEDGQREPMSGGLYIDFGQGEGLDAGQYAAALNFVAGVIVADSPEACPQPHTPGPWIYRPDLDRTDSRVTFRVGSDARDVQGPSDIGTQTAICSNSSALMSVAEAEANARLVAAAPELLEQLKHAREWVAKVSADHHGDHMGTTASRRLERIEAAIELAEGGAE